MNLRDIDLIELYRAWKKNLGYFRCFFRSTPFISLQTYENFQIENRIFEKQDKVLKLLLNKISEKAFCIVDMPFDEIINIALQLNNEFNIKPILNLNIMFNVYGAIGSKNNINNLINASFKLKDINPDNYVMLLDYNRYKDSLDEDYMLNKLNNQYGIGEEDIPEGSVLKELGYKKIAVISKDIKEDLKDIIEYVQNDIDIEIIKVDNNGSY